ncbi:MAG TPA: hypothetical protein VMA83_07925 [Solirubrobacteraceae bacterium]|nr:hypothetical protein [Solirubrobacteraceae bacterium]
MATFFVPSLQGGAGDAERMYRELRDEAEACTGAVSSERRIEGVLCRRSGRDYELRVGQIDTGNGRTVAAIIQLGRGTYTVHHIAADNRQPPEPLVLQRADVYTVTDFQ